MIVELKRGKVGDTQGWTNEMLMEGGDEIGNRCYGYV